MPRTVAVFVAAGPFAVIPAGPAVPTGRPAGWATKDGPVTRAAPAARIAGGGGSR